MKLLERMLTLGITGVVAALAVCLIVLSCMDLWEGFGL
jgi:hypothetical protein